MNRAEYGTPAGGFTNAGRGPTPARAVLIVKRGPNAGSRTHLERAVTTAGRHPTSDIFLDDVSVSRRHAEFQVTGNNDVLIVDLGSLDGTYVNGKPVGSATLADGDEVQLGKFSLVFASGEPRTAEVADGFLAPMTDLNADVTCQPSAT